MLKIVLDLLFKKYLHNFIFFLNMQKIEILIRMFGNFCKELATFKVRKNCLSLLGRRLAHVSVF